MKWNCFLVSAVFLLTTIVVVEGTAAPPPNEAGAEVVLEGRSHKVISYAAEDAHEPIMFFFFTLLLGAVVLLILVRLPEHWPKLPFTVLLFLFGLAMGALTEAGNLDVLGHATNGMVNMDPHLILHAFLPPLLFESAFNMNYHVFTKCFTQAFLLAIPGVIMATGMTGVLCHEWFSEYEWEWTLAFMFGAMVSATDPVAVVGLLSELSAPRPLSTVIEAESLMNDGSAFVIFLIFKDFAAGISLSAGDVIDKSFRMAVGGPALGLAFGIGFSEILFRFCINDPTIEVSLTITAAYLSFWTAEASAFHTSGVLTVVTLGVYMGGIGKRNISPEVHEYMHHVWAFLGHTANTVLFVLSGAFTYNLVADTRITGTDWGYLFVLYILVHITRGITIILLWPALSKLGYGMSVRRGIILWFGGLRGAVGLVLALLVSDEYGIAEVNRVRIQFLVAGLVALTIAINGTTAGLLYKHIGLAETSVGHKTTLKLSLDFIQTNSDELARNIKRLDCWGPLVEQDLEDEMERLAEEHQFTTKNRASRTKCVRTKEDNYKKMVVEWFNNKDSLPDSPSSPGRMILCIPHVRIVNNSTFVAKYKHIQSGPWPPRVKDKLTAKTAVRRFTFSGNKIVSSAGVSEGQEPTYGGKLGFIQKSNFFWYPDFSHMTSLHTVGWLQRFLSSREEDVEQRTGLLAAIREDLRRIVIKAVQHRYSEWREQRIIDSDVYGILEEATFYVEDEDHVWVTNMPGKTTYRGHYDLKLEFKRILEAVGLSGGSLTMALEKKLKKVASYWECRDDMFAKVASWTFSEENTLAYLRNKLRLAIHCLLFYKAAHEDAWHEIEQTWGELMTSGHDGSVYENVVVAEEEDLQWCYDKADELIEKISACLPGVRGTIAAIHESFIHRLLVVQMRQSAQHCSHNGLLTEGDSEKVNAAIRRCLKPFFQTFGSLCGERSRSLREFVRKEEKLERRSDRGFTNFELPKWGHIEEEMQSVVKKSVLDKKTFWEIRLIARLQAMSQRDKIRTTDTEESIAFTTIEERSASIDQDSSPFHKIVLSKTRAAHLSTCSSDEELDEHYLSIDDPCSLRSSGLQKLLVPPNDPDDYSLTMAYRSSLNQHNIQALNTAYKQGIGRKGWVRATRVLSTNGRDTEECLIQCSLVEEKHMFQWYPKKYLMRSPNFIYEELGRKSNPLARSRLIWVIRQVWFRAVVDRVRQQCEDKFPEIIPQIWLNAKQLKHTFMGTLWPWWGCVVQESDVTYTLVANDDGSPNWKFAARGVLLKGICDNAYGTPVVTIRNRKTQINHVIPKDFYKDTDVIVIESHYGDLGLLPASSYVSFVVGGTEFPTTEHYYQSCKYPDIHDRYREERLLYRRRVIEARSVKHVLALGHDKVNGPKIDPNWDTNRDEIMMNGIRAKFTLNHGVKNHHRELLSTGTAVLLATDADDSKPDEERHWSVINRSGKWVGDNVYGKLLMAMREELRDEITAEPFTAAALIVAILSTVLKCQSQYSIGDVVRVRSSNQGRWLPGTVTSVTHNGEPLILAEGQAEPELWRFVEHNNTVSTLCQTCFKTHLEGTSHTSVFCKNCRQETILPVATYLYSYERRILAAETALCPPMMVEGKEYPTILHYYQSLKFPESALRSEIESAPTAEAVLKLALNEDCNPPMRSDWESEVSFDTIPSLYAKIMQCLDEPLQVCVAVLFCCLSKTC